MGDFQANFHRPSTGIHTVEGNVAGSRAAQLERKRQHEQELFEQRKQQIIQTSASQQQSMDSKFAESSVATQTEQSFRTKTIGLVTAEEFKRAQLEQQQAEAAYAKRMAGMDDDDDDDDNVVAAKKLQNQLNETPEQAAARRKAEKKAKKKKRKEQKKLMATLSFANNEEFDEGGLDEQDEKSSDKAKPKAFKDPTIDTSFLPDKERDLRLQQERKQLAKQWKQQQEKIKQEALEITYSYWDGSGHRRTVTITKGTSIGDFLEVVRKDLCKEFRELTSIGSDGLIYVKEDLLLPHDITFYDLITTKARGKSGPLFHFDVHDDVRVGGQGIDHRIEKDESHPGKVIERRWYERNKHIFPASRWEIYDPAKSYGSYTIGDSRKKSK